MLLDILEEHLDDAVFLAGRRAAAFATLDATVGDLAELDARLRAHLDGLLVDADAAWASCGAFLEAGSAAEAFVAGAVAIECGDESRCAVLVERLAAAPPATADGVREAMARAAEDGIEGWLSSLLERPELNVRAAALQALGERGVDPGEALDRALRAEEPQEVVAALRAAYRSGARRTLKHVQRLAGSDEPVLARAALPAFACFAREPAIARCTALLDGEGAAVPTAIDLLGALGARSATRALVTAAGSDEPMRRRHALCALGNLGDPGAVPTLIDALRSSITAGAASVALTRLFGRSLPVSPSASPRPTGDEADEVPDPDADLPVFGADAVAAWWTEAGTSFANAGRVRDGSEWRAAAPEDSTPLWYAATAPVEQAVAGGRDRGSVR